MGREQEWESPNSNPHSDIKLTGPVTQPNLLSWVDVRVHGGWGTRTTFAPPNFFNEGQDMYNNFSSLLLSLAHPMGNFPDSLHKVSFSF